MRIKEGREEQQWGYMRRFGVLAFDKGLRALAQKLQASAGKSDNFALAIFIVFVVRLDVAVRNLGDHLNDLVRLANAFDQSFVLGLKKLQQCPDSNVLECRISAGEEASDVAVDTAGRFRPVLDEDGVVTHCES